MHATTQQIEQLIQALATRKSLVVSVAKGRAVVAALVAQVGRCHTTCGGRHVWRVMVEGAGELVVSVSADAAVAAREGVYLALLGQPEQLQAVTAPAPSARAKVVEELRAATQQILAGVPKQRTQTRQPSRLEVEQMRARAAFGAARRPVEGTQEYRRLRAS